MPREYIFPHLVFGIFIWYFIFHPLPLFIAPLSFCLSGHTRLGESCFIGLGCE